MVCPAGVAHRNSGDSQVLQRFYPLLEYRRDRGVFLQIDATCTAAAVIHVEVAGNFLLVGFELERACRFTQKFGQLDLVSSGGSWEGAEVLRQVSPRCASY